MAPQGSLSDLCSPLQPCRDIARAGPLVGFGGGAVRRSTGPRLPSTGRPGPFDLLHLAAVPLGPVGGPVVGVVFDDRARTATAVLAVRGHSFALLGPTDQDHRIGAWSRVLASLAREGSPVHRLQWIESCLPDHGDAVRTHFEQHAVLGPDTDASRSYDSLIDEASPTTRRHQVLVALTVHAGRSRRSVRAAGGDGRGPGSGPGAGLGAVLLREVVSLQRQLESAEVTVEGVLGPGSLAAVYRDAVSSMDQLELRHRSVGGPVDPAPPWPTAVERHWDAVHTDATWHAVFWIAEWPRVDVTPDFLGPLFFSPVRRTLSVTMEPVDPRRAARQVAQARTADLADGELRRRGGFLVTARQVREKEGVEHRDTELADGHAQYRFSGYLSVTADTREELRDGCAAIEQAAGQARLELRRLYGEQDVAFSAVLPLGRGLS